MSDDGAELGIAAEDGMKAAIAGGEEPPRRTKEEVRATVMGTEFSSIYDYNTSANAAAKIILLTIEGHPEIDWANTPTEGKYEYVGKDGVVLTRQQINDGAVGTFTKIEDGWYDKMKPLIIDTALGDAWDKLGLSGFQWGWAVNCARWLLDMPPVDNPAIVRLG
jgi:hypothetical protein